MTASPGVPRTRLILYVGKGGVGKTTMAAATAAVAAMHGHRTLVVSTDIAHSLGDVLERNFTGEPLEVGPNLYGQEVDVLEETRRGWGEVQHHISDALRREGISAVQADELAVVPGMQEIAALVQIGRKAREGEFDCIVVDAAPTGETIRLLTMPESFAWYAAKLQAWRGNLNRITRKLLRLPSLAGLDVLDQLTARIDELRALLTNPERTSYRIVLTPDRAVLKEALRAETYLNLFEYPVDSVIVNRVMDESINGSDYIRKLVTRQQALLEEIQHAFGALPILTGGLHSEEPLGVSQLEAFGHEVFGEIDPTAILHRGFTISLEQSGEGFVLRIPVPNIELAKLNLTKRGDVLYVDVGNFRREIPLPFALASTEPTVARMRSGALEIEFEPVAEEVQDDESEAGEPATRKL